MEVRRSRPPRSSQVTQGTRRPINVGAVMVSRWDPPGGNRTGTGWLTGADVHHWGGRGGEGFHPSDLWRSRPSEVEGSDGGNDQIRYSPDMYRNNHRGGSALFSSACWNRSSIPAAAVAPQLSSEVLVHLGTCSGPSEDASPPVSARELFFSGV